MVARTNSKNESGSRDAFHDHLDSIFFEGYAEWLKEDNYDSYSFYYDEFKSQSLAA